ncbi:LysR family transcriptional regulator [Bradyrhizobium sp. UFLA05-112]
MKRADLPDLAAFAAIARLKSFRRAASELNVSPSALSHGMRALEERMGVRLLNRTTRALALTEAGQKLLAKLDPALAAIETAVNEAASFAHGPSGSLRINAPRSVSRLILLPPLKRFLRRYPRVSVELASDDALTDIVAAGFDAGVRFDEKLPRDMIAIALSGPMRFSLVGSPDYFATRAIPRVPADLKGHMGICQRFPGGGLFAWPLEKDGDELEFIPEGPLVLDDQELILDACLEGFGLACVFEPYAAPDIAAGRLKAVLCDWQPMFAGPSLYYPSRRRMPRPLRAFIDMVREEQA